MSSLILLTQMVWLNYYLSWDSGDPNGVVLETVMRAWMPVAVSFFPCTLIIPKTSNSN